MQQKSVFRKYPSFIQNISVVSCQGLKKLLLGFTTWFTKNYNLQGFKELQDVDLQLDLQRNKTWKMVIFFLII